MIVADLLQGWENRSAEEALAELEREQNVRRKCFVRWIEEGRVARVDAKDRIQRLEKAFHLLTSFVMRAEAAAVANVLQGSTNNANPSGMSEKELEKAIDDAVPF